MRRALGHVGLAVILATAVLAVPAAGAPAGIAWSKHGFSVLVAQLVVQPDQAASVRIGDERFVIPVGAFGPHPVRFRVLAGSPRFFRRYVPGGQRILAAFAFEVRDLITVQPVLTFRKPVTYILTSPEVSSEAVYWNATPTSPPHVTRNPVPATISGHTLRHENLSASVGWLVTAPQAAALGEVPSKNK